LRRAFLIIPLALVCFSLSQTAQALNPPHPSFITFDVTGAAFGTFPSGINSKGAITGWYSLTGFPDSHGFVRGANGAITAFD